MPTHSLVTALSVLVDIVIVMVVLETIYLTTATNTRNAAARWMTAANNAAGLCLLLAIRFAFNDNGPGLIVLALAGALLAHLAELRLRHQALLWGARRDNNES